MRKHRLSIGLTLAAAVAVLWLTGRNLGQELPPTALRAADDIAAWEGAVFVLEGKTLTKLNEQLEVVKSIPLPLDPTPIPPSPIPDAPVEPSLRRPQASTPPVPLVDSTGGGRLAADGQKVYVLYQGIILAFDHDLNYLLAKPQDYTQ